MLTSCSGWVSVDARSLHILPTDTDITMCDCGGKMENIALLRGYFVRFVRGKMSEINKHK
jgi:hypothetical protein